MKVQAIMLANMKNIPVMHLCKEANMQKSSYYSFSKNTKMQEKDQFLVDAMSKLSSEDIEKGSKHKVQCLLKLGIVVGYKRMWRFCHNYGFLSKIRARKHPKDYYKKRKEELKETVASNILDRQFECAEPLTKLCTDITYIKTKRGWLFLCVIIDLCTREIVAYQISKHINAKLALDTLKDLKENYPDIGEKCILHSDQGATYTSIEFRNLVKESGFIQSMSRKCNCYDNAIVENFFGTLKNETIYKDTLKKEKLTYEEAERMVIDFIDYYNKRRIQERLDWMSPHDFKMKVIDKMLPLLDTK